MAQTVDNSLEGRLADVESAVRSMRATNLTDLASVTNAEGQAVALSALAFGMVTVVSPADDYQEITGPRGVVGDSGFIIAAPSLDVFVTGARLRVDIAATVFARGDHCSYRMSYALTYLGPAGAKGTVSVRVKDPDPVNAVSVQDQSTTPTNGSVNAAGAVFSAGTFGLHTVPQPGWYRVDAAYNLSYNATYGLPPFGNSENRRIAATPY